MAHGQHLFGGEYHRRYVRVWMPFHAIGIKGTYTHSSTYIVLENIKKYTLDI